MPTIKIAPLRTFPKKVIKFVKLGFLFPEIVMKCLKHNYFAASEMLISEKSETISVSNGA